MAAKTTRTARNATKKTRTLIRPPLLEKLSLHPRNRHRGRYDFAALSQALPALEGFLVDPWSAKPQTPTSNECSWRDQDGKDVRCSALQFGMKGRDVEDATKGLGSKIAFGLHRVLLHQIPTAHDHAERHSAGFSAEKSL